MLRPRFALVAYWPFEKRHKELGPKTWKESYILDLNLALQSITVNAYPTLLLILLDLMLRKRTVSLCMKGCFFRQVWQRHKFIVMTWWLFMCPTCYKFCVMKKKHLNVRVVRVYKQRFVRDVYIYLLMCSRAPLWCDVDKSSIDCCDRFLSSFS